YPGNESSGVIDCAEAADAAMIDRLAPAIRQRTKLWREYLVIWRVPPATHRARGAPPRGMSPRHAGCNAATPSPVFNRQGRAAASNRPVYHRAEILLFENRLVHLLDEFAHSADEWRSSADQDGKPRIR